MKSSKILITVIWGLLLFTFNEVHAQTPLLDKEVTLSLEDQPISDVLDIIQRLSKVDFAYSPSLIPSSEKISIHVADKKIDEVLNILFANYHIDYKEFNDQIIIRKKKGNKTIFKEPEELRKISIVTVYDTVITNDTLHHNTFDTIVTLKYETIVDTITIVTYDTLVHHDTIHTIIYHKRGLDKYFGIGASTNGLLFVPNFSSSDTGVVFNQQYFHNLMYGIDFTYFKDAYSFGVGVNWSQVSSKINSTYYTDLNYYNVTHLDTFLIEIAPSTYDSMIVKDSTLETIANSIENKEDANSTIHYIEIPINIGYEAVRIEKWTININLGLNTGFRIISNGSSLNQHGVLEDNSPMKLRDIHFVTSTGVSVAYYIAENSRISLKLRYRKGMHTLTKETHYPMQFYNAYSIGIGYQYLF